MRIGKNKNQLLILILAVGFLIGIIYQNILSSRNMLTVELFQREQLQQYLQTQVVGEKFIWYVVKSRVMILAALLLLGCVRWKKMLAVSCLLIIGFFGGILAVSATLQLGMKGILLCLAGILPQGIFYGMMYWVLITYWFHYPERQWNRAKIIFLAVLFVLGMLVEVYVNPLIVKAVIKML